MPAIDQTGTYHHNLSGWEFLNVRSPATITLLFAGTTLPTTLEIKYTDDEGVDQVFEDGTITALPKSVTLGPIHRPLKIVATGGSPNMNCTYGGSLK